MHAKNASYRKDKHIYCLQWAHIPSADLFSPSCLDCFLTLFSPLFSIGAIVDHTLMMTNCNAMCHRIIHWIRLLLQTSSIYNVYFVIIIMHEKMSLSAGSPFSNMFKFENIEAACDDKYTVSEWREGEITSHRNMTTTIIIFFFCRTSCNWDYDQWNGGPDRRFSVLHFKLRLSFAISDFHHNICFLQVITCCICKQFSCW